MAFPSTAMDTGTLSRILFIHSNPSSKTILIPQRPPHEAMVTMLKWLAEIKKKVQGAFTITEDALSAQIIFIKILNHWKIPVSLSIVDAA